MRATCCPLVNSVNRLAGITAILVAAALAIYQCRDGVVRAQDKPPTQSKPLPIDSSTTKQPPVAKASTAKTVALTISGKAMDAERKPVVGATINLCVGPSPKIAATTMSDSAGRYEFKNVEIPVRPASGSREELYAGGFSLYGTASGYGFAWSGRRDYWDKDKPNDAGIIVGDERTRQGGIDIYRNERPTVDLEFTPAASLTGHVIDEDNQPVAGAKVSLWSADYLNGDGKALQGYYRAFSGMAEYLKDKVVAHADKEGRFVIGGLPSEVCFGVSVESSGFGRLSLYAATTSRPLTMHRFNESATTIRNNIQVEIAAPDSHEVRTGDLTILLHRVRNVLIDVAEGDSGSPAPRVTVETAGQFGGGVSAYGKTDRNGRVVLKLPMGQYKLVADPPRNSLYVRTWAKLDGTADRDKEPFTIRLTRGCVVNFIAVDSESGKGIEAIGFQAEQSSAEAPNAVLMRGQLVQATTGWINNPTTDKDGRMQAVMQPGVYKFIATPQWLGRRNVGDEYESAIGPGPTRLPSGETVEVKLQLKRKPTADKPSLEKSSRSDRHIRVPASDNELAEKRSEPFPIQLN